MNCPEISPFYQ
ncbi:unnamed protein product [Cuscuta epithymum]|nr:unnamed protein product [Cuscuta epithymum]